MSNIVSLAAFLAARLEEDEAAARAAADCDGHLSWWDSRVAASGDHTIRTGWLYPQPEGGRPVCRIRRDDSEGDAEDDRTLDPDAVASYIARYDPVRALREVAAKRAILEPHRPGLPPEGAPEGLVICAGCEADGDTWQMATEWPCPDVQAVAAVWNDHPDYDPAWKP